jgi:hypothetical protein
MKEMLGQLAIPTRRAGLVAFAAAWMLAVASVAPAAAQEGPGVRAGLGANPDQFFVGGHYVTRQLADRLRFQPNVEAGFGSGATLVSFNAEFGFWMRLNPEWQVYVGGGPAMILFSSNHRDSTDIKPGFNLLAGVRTRSGLFFELKVGVLDSPDVKLAIGYTFR